MRRDNYNLPKISIPVLIVLFAGLLTLASLLVVLYNAIEEPFAIFRTHEAIIQVGGSCALFLLWLQLALGIIFGIVTRRIAPSFILILLWGWLVCSILHFAMMGYIGDVQGFAHLRAQG